MTQINIRLFKRNFTDMLVVPDVKFDVQRMSWKTIGGADQATITATGNKNQLWELVELLRCPIEIFTKEKDPLWWGYIESVDLQLEMLRISITLEGMANRVCVVYSQVNTTGNAGERATTSWIQNDDSVAEYGTIETRSALSQGTEEQANTQAATILERLKLPLSKHQFRKSGQINATIHCAGWWKTLDWKYYANNAGKESYEESASELQALGDNSIRTKIAQSWLVSSAVAWQAQSVKVRVQRVGNPSDNMIVSLCADNSGAPGSVLANASLAGLTIDENMTWYELILSNRVSVNINTTYWLVVTRSGSVSGVNYYQLGVNEDLGYTNGVMRVWNGNSWIARSPDADLLFAVGGVIETSQQVRLISETGQFITGIDTEISSTVYASPYRDGDQSALTCIEELLNSGTGNQRRMFASVDVNRRVKIYEEPASGNRDYFISSDGHVNNWLNLPLRDYEIPVGVWAKLKDTIPATANVSKLADPSKVFIEGVEYDVEQEQVILTERDMQRMTDITVR